MPLPPKSLIVFPIASPPNTVPPEGLLTAPVSVDFSQFPQNLPILIGDFVNTTGARYDMNLQSISGVKQMSSVKSLIYLVRFSFVAVQTGSIVIYVPDSGQMVEIAPSAKLPTAAPPGNTTPLCSQPVVSGCIPILSNASPSIQIFNVADATGHNNALCHFVACNFDVKDYTIQGSL